MEMWTVVLFAGSLAFYFLPTLIAAGRAHHNGVAILLLNLLLGWTLLGWVAALIWSATAVQRPERLSPSSA